MAFLEAEDSTENDFILKSSDLYINFINKRIISDNSLIQENLLINDNLESCNFTQIKNENVYSQAYEDLWNDYFKGKFFISNILLVRFNYILLFM